MCRIGQPCKWASQEAESMYFQQACLVWKWDLLTQMIQAYWLLCGYHDERMHDNMIWCFDNNLIVFV